MGAPLYRNRYRVPSARKTGWDYRWAGVYAVTICVRDRLCCLGEVREGRVDLSPSGEAVAAEWQRIPEVHRHVVLDDWVVMPDHLHGILIFQSVQTGPPVAASRLAARSLGAVIGQFKKRVQKRLWALRLPHFVWQERFFDQILPHSQALENYRAYIRDNPLQWNESTEQSTEQSTDQSTEP